MFEGYAIMILCKHKQEVTVKAPYSRGLRFANEPRIWNAFCMKLEE